MPELTGAHDDEIQRRLAEAVQAYAARVQERGDLDPFPPGAEVTPTEVAITTAALLKAAGVYSFEIAAMFDV